MSGFRNFQPEDAADCLALFDSNTPAFFGIHERKEFADFLSDASRPGSYLVMEHEGRVVACGGLASLDDTTAGFVWGMVDRTMHRHGFGKELALARIEQAQAMGKRCVKLSTTQHVQAFYAKLGFTPGAVVTDGYGPGLDSVEMVLLLPMI